PRGRRVQRRAEANRRDRNGLARADEAHHRLLEGKSLAGYRIGRQGLGTGGGGERRRGVSCRYHAGRERRLRGSRTMAAVTRSRGGPRGGIVGINVTPMVDVVLVLLVIMMVSATYIVSQSLKVELPKTATSDEQTAKTFVVTIQKDGKLFFNNEPV